MESSPRACLTRREFVRRTAMGAVAAAAAGRVAAWPSGLAHAAVIGDSRLPALIVDKPVSGVAAFGDHLVAVGGDPGDPRVWSLAPDAGAWELAAVASSFPAGTVLKSVAHAAGDVVAVGSTIDGSGARPAVFRSTDSQRWRADQSPLGSSPGVLTAVAGHAGRLLAVGSRFQEPAVGEPAGMVAISAAPGDPWSTIDLPGVAPTQHGAASLLAAVPEGFLLAVTDVSGLALYTAADAQGPWRRISPPRSLDAPASIVAAGAVGARMVLAAIDALDRGRFWIGGSRGWRELQVPASLPAAARVVSLADREDVLVAAGDGDGSSFIEEVSVA